jgi:3-mercaptopyruvate sulfurtransferase SseA
MNAKPVNDTDGSLRSTDFSLGGVALTDTVEVRREGKFSYYRLAGKEACQIWQSIRDFAAVKVAEVQRLSVQYLYRRDELEALSIAELRRRLAAGDVVLIDVRPEAEYRAGHIPSALSVPVQKLATMLRKQSRTEAASAGIRGARN